MSFQLKPNLFQRATTECSLAADLFIENPNSTRASPVSPLAEQPQSSLWSREWSQVPVMHADELTPVAKRLVEHLKHAGLS
jgi:hypothetical protein